jgi:hypothetical protein
MVWFWSGGEIENWMGVIKSFAKDTRTLFLNVLASTGFRRSSEFQSANDVKKEDNGEDAASSYRNALSTALDNDIILMLLPYGRLSLPIFPKSFQRIRKAGVDYKQHMERMLEGETAALNPGEPGAESMMTAFVKALNTSEPKNGGSKPKGLSVEEIFGDIFVMNFAGHDTTANTPAFAMGLLASEPDVQDWVAQELHEVVPRVDDEWEYSPIYPQLLRCRAVLVSKPFPSFSDTMCGPANIVWYTPPLSTHHCPSKTHQLHPSTPHIRGANGTHPGQYVHQP